MEEFNGFKDLRIGENDSDTENIIYSPEIKTMPMVALRGKVVGLALKRL